MKVFIFYFSCVIFFLSFFWLMMDSDMERMMMMKNKTEILFQINVKLKVGSFFFTFSDNQPRRFQSLLSSIHFRAQQNLSKIELRLSVCVCVSFCGQTFSIRFANFFWFWGCPFVAGPEKKPMWISSLAKIFWDWE